MKIAGYVGDLLYDYECVVIPGLGGFITKDKPAQVVAVTHHFKPPFREVLFNIHLKTNDGLLVNYVARQEELSYNEAKSRVDVFAFECRNALDAGKRIRFHGIGSLSRDEDQNIVFSQDKSINYNPQAFGLGSFVSPAIARTSDEEKVMGAIKKVVPEKKPVQEAKPAPVKPKRILIATRKKSTFVSQFIFLMVVFFMMGVGYIYMHRHAMSYYWENHAHQIPLFYTSPQAYYANNIDLLPIEKLSYYSALWLPGLYESNDQPQTAHKQPIDISQATLIPIQSANTMKVDQELIEEPGILETIAEKISGEPITKEVKNPPETVEHEALNTSVTTPAVVPSSSTSYNYYIIAGSFNNEKNALNLVAQLKANGFDAMIADTNKYGMFRVAFKGFKNEADASQELVTIKNRHNQEAWLLKK